MVVVVPLLTLTLTGLAAVVDADSNQTQNVGMIEFAHAQRLVEEEARLATSAAGGPARDAGGRF